jgi:antitoxin component HigA of HigAB toxin-antitoxin module
MLKINNKQQYYAAMAEIEGFLQRGFSNLTEKEEDQLERLTKAAEAWELKEYPMPMHPSFPDILTAVMQHKRFTQSDLSQSLSISKSLLSEILSGKKQPNLEVIVNLYKVYGIDAETLLDSVAEASPTYGQKASAPVRYGKNPPSKNAY